MSDRASREARYLWLVAAALLLISLVPFFLVDMPAVSDYPNHLARLFILAHPDDPILSHFYAPAWRILPNLGVDVLGVGLLKLLPVYMGGRVLLALSLVAPVLGALVYARAAFGRLSFWPLVSVVTAFNGIFFLGFMNFLLATGLAFAAAGIWLILRRENRDGWCLFFGAASSALLFFCHIFGVFLFALLIGSQELARARERGSAATGQILRALGLIAVALMPAIFLYLASPLSAHPADIGGWDGKHKLSGLFTPFMTTSMTVTLATGFAVFGFLILCARRASFAPGTKTALLVLALLYVAVPVTVKGGTFVDIRLSLMMGLLLFAGIDLRLTETWKRWGLLALALLVCVRILVTGLAWHDHRRDLLDLRAAMAAIPQGARVLAALGTNAQTDPSAPARNLPDVSRLDRYLPALLVIERKAFWPAIFADPSQQPLAIKAPFNHMPDGLSVVPDWGSLLSPPDAGSPAAPQPGRVHWRDAFDYVLLIDRPPSLRPPADLIPVYIGGYTALWRIAH